MVEKELILIVGGVLIAAVVAHGIWLAWPRREAAPEPDVAAAPADEGDAETANSDYEDGILSAPRRVGGAAPEPAPVALREDASPAGAASPRPVPNGATGRIAATTAAPGPGPDAIVPDPLPRARAARPAGADKPVPPRAGARPARGNGKPRPAPAAADPTELFAINVLARNGGRFGGTELLEAFVRHGLKYRERNIFHRLDPDTDEVRYSVANAVEPGYFDLSDMDAFSTPGVSLFFQLPGTPEPAATFDDMLTVARDLGSALGGDLKDEKLSVLTGQTISHFRERIAEFSRKQMSARAPHG